MTNAKNLDISDWQHIIDSIQQGYVCGEVHLINGVSGFWSLADKGIIININQG